MKENGNDKDIQAAVRRLGENLKSLGQHAWESPERRQLQTELETTLVQIENAVKNAEDDFRQSETGERLLQDLRRIRDSFEAGEVGQRMRSELVQMVNRLNREMEQWLKPDDDEVTRGDIDPGESE